MKTIHLLFLLLTIVPELRSQPDTLKNGAYRNVVDFKNNKPLFVTDFEFIKTAHSRIPELYRIFAKESRFTRKINSNSVWAIWCDGNLYLNAKRLNMANGYIKICKPLKYNYFKGGPVMTQIQKNRLQNAGQNFGLLGLSISGIIINEENKKDLHYFLILETGMINLVTKPNVLRVLQSNEDLLEKYEHEDNNESLEVLLKYLSLLNGA